jgi:hypothetical protein
MIHISAKTFDISGALTIRPLPDDQEAGMIRRVNRVATLDGSVAVNDRGFSHGDRDWTVIYKPVSRAHDDIARRLVSLHTRVYLSTEEGCFEASPAEFQAGADKNTFTLLIIDKVSED